MTIQLIPAIHYTIEQLTEAYNQTRVDYMVPMPMNAARLAEYVHVYDVSIENSLVALENSHMVGLGMLAVRPERTWITRLGLISDQRGKGIGQALMEGLLANSDALTIPQNMLEVIKGNVPAHTLFLKLGFENVRELLILRRAPHTIPKPTTKCYPMNRGDMIFHLNKRQDAQAWTNQTESLAHVKGLNGFHVYTPNGGHGWLVFQRTLFNISRLMFDTEGGESSEIMLELLRHLHSQHPDIDTYTENIPTDDPHLPAFWACDYLEAFTRVEMFRFPT
jgi:GNAT superfamily N-acetyltransferase